MTDIPKDPRTAFDHYRGFGLQIFPTHRKDIPEKDILAKRPVKYAAGVTGKAGEIRSVRPQSNRDNIALRLPPGIVGMDVDAYGDKQGAETLKWLEEEYGPLGLEETDRSSARPAPSGIYYFRGPVGWQGENLPGIEFIQHTYRYAIVEPSFHYETGEMYRWYCAGDEPHYASGFANVPWLAQGIVDNHGSVVGETETVRENPASDVLTEGEPCRYVTHLLGKFQEKANESRHGAMVETQYSLIMAGSEGHPGVNDAINELGVNFQDALDNKAPTRDGTAEFDEALDSGLHRVPDRGRDTDPCQDPDPLAFGIDDFGDSGTVTEPEPESEGNYPQLPEWFWQSRTELDHIRQAAHANTASADVVLHATLARLSAMVPPQVRVNTGYKKPVSLNYFAVVLGKSGGGKSSSADVPEDLIPAEPLPQNNHPLWKFRSPAQLGTGEGAIEQYLVMKNKATGVFDDKGKEVYEKVKVQERQHVYFYADEGSQIISMSERSGSTLNKVLCTAWLAGAQGMGNASNETSRELKKGTYSMGLVMGFQPTKVGALLSDSSGGTPQRFMFCGARDASLPNEPGTVDPGALKGVTVTPSQVETQRLSTAGTDKEIQPFWLSYPEDLQRQVYAEEIARIKGETEYDEYDSHRSASIAKISGLLALLRGEVDGQISTEDYELATCVWETSCAVRDQARNEEKRREKKDKQRRKDERIEEAAEVENIGRDTERVKNKIVRHLTKKGATTVAGVKRNGVDSKDRSVFKAALQAAEGDGLVEIEGDKIRLVRGT